MGRYAGVTLPKLVKIADSKGLFYKQITAQTLRTLKFWLCAVFYG